MMRRLLVPVALLAAAFMLWLGAHDPLSDPRLKNCYRRPEQNGWTFVHLEGTPAQIGYQHGVLLAAEIKDGFEVQKLELTHDGKKDWGFFRKAAKEILWPHIEQQYREELQGISAGVTARGVKLDVWDIVALNASEEWSYYVKWYDTQHGIANGKSAAPDHCSAFVATGSYTKDGKPVIAHNNWTNYLDGERWTIIFDVVPAAGHRFLMDGYPGLIHSADDFGVNDAGIAITETTISDFAGWDSSGVPEFVRARRAMQYATSIDEFAATMKDGNNGGYANDWLIVDVKNNEVAHLELGLKNVTLERTKDGYFVGANFPKNPKLAKEETTFKMDDMGVSGNARHARWDQLMAEYKGKIDAPAAQKFLADHYDTYDQKDQASERTLDGEVDKSSRGMGDWQPPFAPAGAVQNKVADAEMIRRLSFTAHAGHASGDDFIAAELFAKHPEFEWQKPLLHDMRAQPWTTFEALQITPAATK
jgi:hypothetical protein